MTTKEQSLERLIERVKVATEYDAELEAAIWLAVVPGASRRNVMANFAGEDSIWEYHDPERNTYARFIPSIMRSTDAALALVERLCPDLVIVFTRIGDGSGMLQITEAWRSESGGRVVDAMSPLDPMPGPLAILAALLQALKETSNEHE